MKTVGTKYEATKNLSTAEIAKLFRADVKAALAAGDLPVGLRLSVKTRTYSGGSSIDIMIKNFPVPGATINNREQVQFEIDNGPHVYSGLPWISTEAKTLTETLERMLHAYGFDNSDTQSDYFHVRFYGHATFDHDLVSADRELLRMELDKPAPILTLVPMPDETPEPTEDQVAAGYDPMCPDWAGW